MSQEGGRKEDKREGERQEGWREEVEARVCAGVLGLPKVLVEWDDPLVLLPLTENGGETSLGRKKGRKQVTLCKCMAKLCEVQYAKTCGRVTERRRRVGSGRGGPVVRQCT